MLHDVQHLMRKAVADCPDSPRVTAVSAEPVPSGASSHGHGSRKPGVALIDEFPLRRASTLNLLRTYFRQGVQQFASSAEFLRHASTCADTPSAVVICVGERSVTDTLLPGHLPLMRRALPALRVIVLSSREEAEEVIAAFHEGVQGYIPTSLAPRLVICAIRIVLAGGTFYPADTLIRARRLIRPEIKPAPCPEQVPAEHREQWPPRQFAVLCLLAQGKANKQIAQILEIEEGTVKIHLRHIMRKLGVANRTQAALAARRLGISATLDDTLSAITLAHDTAPASTQPV